MTEPDLTLWLRDELKPGEARAAITPHTARTLIADGRSLTVERSTQRVFDDDEFAAAGATLVDSGAWRQLRARDRTLVVGLKELDAELGPFPALHAHFAHAFKRQQGSQAVLEAFASGGGRLFDLEYLVDERGRRLAAFGYWAGWVGAALGVLALAAARSIDGGPLVGPLVPFSSREDLLDAARAACSSARDTGSEPRALVFGALGRSGRGACDLFDALQLDVTRWDRAETRDGGPFEAVLEHALVVNCVFIDGRLPPFTTPAALAGANRMTEVIVDVSCDPYGDDNPLPIYAEPTTLAHPVARLLPGERSRAPLDLIAIDHLPSLLPRESSEDFAQQLLPALMSLRTVSELERGPFARSAAAFERAREALRSDAHSDSAAAPRTDDRPT